MSLPKSLIIMGIKVKIELNDDPDNHGTCDPVSRIIYIRRTDSYKTQQETLLHECLHMILGLSGMSNLLSEEVEESIVLALETGLIPLIPKLLQGD